MIATSITRMAVPYLALVAVCGAATMVGITHVWREPPVETRAVTAAPAVLPPAPGGRADSSPAAIAKAQTEANAAVAALAAAPASPDGDQSVPVFDVARIERSGDAVIAGRAAPGATVELLRNGERHDRVVADRSGQFVMVPSRLPPGDYELTLRSTQPDGKQVTSQQSVVVALAAAEPNAGAARSRAEMPVNVPERVAAGRAVLDQAVASSQAIEPSAGSPSADVAPKTGTKAVTTAATMVVSRGDSLWRISNLTYGDGVRYAILYKANRHQIRNPNRIYPGQVFVLPGKVR